MKRHIIAIIALLAVTAGAETEMVGLVEVGGDLRVYAWDDGGDVEIITVNGMK